MTTWNGLEVCGPGTQVTETFPPSNQQFQATEKEWQCAELAARYLFIAYGAPPIVADGNQIVDNYTSTYSDLFTKVTNDGSHLIKVGDVLSYYSPDNHTAIVSDTSHMYDATNPYITVIEQNADSSGHHNQSVSSGGGTAYPVILNGFDNSTTNGNTVQAWLTPNNSKSWSNASPTGSNSDHIYSMAANSTTVWAAGNERPSGSINNYQPVTFYNSGSGWTKNLIPYAGNRQPEYLYGIATSSSGDTWTVGNLYNGLQYVTLAYHWNSSTQTWTNVPSDSPGSGSYLQSDAIDSSGNVWADGYYYNGSNYVPLIEKWNGTKFAQQTLPLPSGDTFGQLSSISFSSSSNGWAAGFAGNSSGYSWVIYHYDGLSWSSYTLGSQYRGGIHSITVASDSEAWAVASWWNGSYWKPLVLHYTASGWAQDTSYDSYFPVVSNNPANLNSIAADGTNDVWIVGYQWNGTYTDAFTLHYNGWVWIRSNTPDDVPGSSSAYLQSVAVNSGNAYAGGYLGSSPTPLVYQYI